MVPDHRPAAATAGGVVHIASGCLTMIGAATVAYGGFVPVDPAVEALLRQLGFGSPGEPVLFLGFPIDGPVFLVLSLLVALCIAAVGVWEVRIGRMTLRGVDYFAAFSFGIAWCLLSLGLANYLGFLLAGTAAVSVWMARGWFREMEVAAKDRLLKAPHRYKDWTLPDAPTELTPSGREVTPPEGDERGHPAADGEHREQQQAPEG